MSVYVGVGARTTSEQKPMGLGLSGAGVRRTALSFVIIRISQWRPSVASETKRQRRGRAARSGGAGLETTEWTLTEDLQLFLLFSFHFGYTTVAPLNAAIPRESGEQVFSVLVTREWPSAVQNEQIFFSLHLHRSRLLLSHPFEMLILLNHNTMTETKVSSSGEMNRTEKNCGFGSTLADRKVNKCE